MRKTKQRVSRLRMFIKKDVSQKNTSDGSIGHLIKKFVGDP